MTENLLHTDDRGKKLKFDQVLQHLGAFGPYQKRIYLLVCIPIVISAFHKLVWVFVGAVPPHRCFLPEYDYNATDYILPDSILNQSIPWDAKNERWSQCEMYGHKRSIVSCTRIVYDTSRYASTVVMEFGLVCSHNWRRALVHSLYAIGEMSGAVIMGTFSDNIGRKKVLTFSLIGISILGITAGSIKNFYTFLILRILVGMCAQGIMLVCFVLSVEFVGPSKRVLGGMLSNYFFALGYLGIAGFSYFLRNWQHLQIAISIPSIFLCLSLWWIPESARWLLSVGRNEEALVIIRRAAKVNGKSLPSWNIEDSTTSCARVRTVDLLLNPSMCYKVLVLSYCWLVNATVYYGLSLNTSNLGGNDYLNFLIAALVEFPAYTFAILIMFKVSRRYIVCGCMVTGGLCLMSTIFIPLYYKMLTTCMAMIGKFCISISYAIALVIAAELYPTGLRNAAIGVNSTGSKIGSIMTSFIVLLGDYWRPLPLVILGGMSCSAGLLVLVLPETKDKNLPETLDDVENSETKTSPTKDVWQYERGRISRPT